ncbi:hypothetical protein BU16DRAFT_539560 [Lophium mytilinum]|uniref:Xylanolytic transcriptional activator regulatory domain-containing protein n=1 Tax=Lophium mytilinum TaxID=390894 RepID=A0A6A6QT97_9PEZI|nr:hypothetical protein BU16DRAFT_539560 [Lophium mytilinum]
MCKCIIQGLLICINLSTSLRSSLYFCSTPLNCSCEQGCFSGVLEKAKYLFIFYTGFLPLLGNCKANKAKNTAGHNHCKGNEGVTELDQAVLHVRDGSEASSAPKVSQWQADVPVLASPLHTIDPFRYASLRKPTVDVQISTEVLKVVGTQDNMIAIADAFFNSVATRIPIVSVPRFNERLPSLSLSTPADFSALCLCMYLSQQHPLSQAESMQSSLYVTAKSFISLLEATSYQSLEVVQCRLLLTFYEMGHGIYPAASISIGACARMARYIGLHKANKQTLQPGSTRIDAEERRRVWWAVVNLERFINLCSGDALFGTDDPQAQDSLPIEDSIWLQRQQTTNHTLSTTSDVTVGQFARECQVSHLVGRVLRHVFDPTSDPAFQANEALQLERTLMAFMPLLMDEELQFGKYCAALGICSSALFTLYDSAMSRLQENSEVDQLRIFSSLEPLSRRIVDFSGQLFGKAEDIDYETLSPYVPYSLYQAAAVQCQLRKKTGDGVYETGLDSLKQVLRYFNKRWLIAGIVTFL